MKYILRTLILILMTLVLLIIIVAINKEPIIMMVKG